jgi:hypothetical protein
MLPPLGISIEGEARQANYRLNCSYYCFLKNICS